MIPPDTSKLPDGVKPCKPCGGSGNAPGRFNKKGRPIRCGKCKGRGVEGTPRQAYPSTVGISWNTSHFFANRDDTSTW